MTKYAGLVGYVTQIETRPGIWEPKSTEKKMTGDVLNLGHSYDTGNKVNDDITLQHKISLVGSPYAYSNLYNLRYLWYMGEKWKIIGVAVERPRIVVTIGGVWNATT